MSVFERPFMRPATRSLVCPANTSSESKLAGHSGQRGLVLARSIIFLPGRIIVARKWQVFCGKLDTGSSLGHKRGCRLHPPHRGKNARTIKYKTPSTPAVPAFVSTRLVFLNAEASSFRMLLLREAPGDASQSSKNVFRRWISFRPGASPHRIRQLQFFGKRRFAFRKM